MRNGEMAVWMLREKVMDYRIRYGLTWSEIEKLVYGDGYRDSTHIKRILGIDKQKGEFHKVIRVETATKIARALELDFHEVDL